MSFDFSSQKKLLLRSSKLLFDNNIVIPSVLLSAFSSSLHSRSASLRADLGFCLWFSLVVFCFNSWPYPFIFIVLLENLFYVHAVLSFYAVLSFFFFKFTYLFKEREKESRGGTEREGERESQGVSALSVQSLMQGSNSQTVRSWPEQKPRIRCFTDGATQASHLLDTFIFF